MILRYYTNISFYSLNFFFFWNHDCEHVGSAIAVSSNITLFTLTATLWTVMKLANHKRWGGRSPTTAIYICTIMSRRIKGFAYIILAGLTEGFVVNTETKAHLTAGKPISLINVQGCWNFQKWKWIRYNLWLRFFVSKRLINRK